MVLAAVLLHALWNQATMKPGGVHCFSFITSPP